MNNSNINIRNIDNDLNMILNGGSKEKKKVKKSNKVHRPTKEKVKEKPVDIMSPRKVKEVKYVPTKKINPEYISVKEEKKVDPAKFEIWSPYDEIAEKYPEMSKVEKYVQKYSEEEN